MPGQNSLAIYTIIIIIALLFIAGRNDNMEKQNSDSQTAQNNKTSGWKTYANNEYGFEFKHPADMHIKDELNDRYFPVIRVLRQSAADDSFKRLTVEFQVRAPQNIRNNSDQTKSKIYKNECAEVEAEASNNPNISKININGTDFFLSKSELHTKGGGLYQAYYYTNKNNQCYRLGIILDFGYDLQFSDNIIKQAEKTGEQIVSTFRFTK